MNKRFIGVLIFAFFVASAGGFLVYRSLTNTPAATKAAAPTARIVVAARDLQVGSILRDGDLRVAEWTGTAPTGSSVHPQDFIGRGVLTTIYSNEPVIETRLAAKGAGGGLASIIPQGMRAFAVRVNDVVGVAGFVTPGMRVDVIINGNSPGGNGSQGTLARTLMQNVEVLSAGQEIKPDSEGKAVVTQVVTLLVTPDGAEKLSLAVNQTTIQLVLRNPIDRDVAKTPGSAVAQLFSGATQGAAPVATDDAKPRTAARRPVAPKLPVVQEAEPPKKEAPFTMEIIMGTKKSETRFQSGEGK